ncbi:MAG: hypothetical protein R3290_03930 [Acidimicrobiia bacterium]|nr:hypothetical protein [Acidimicrobiia bacterium]
MRRLRDDDRGVTIVELGVSMFGLAFVAAIMLSWFVGASRVDELHRNDDEVIQELRTSRQLLTKDIRRARQVTTAGLQSITVWVDADHDDIVDGGELVSWTLESDGDLVRADDAGGAVTQATGLLVAGSGFGYDAELAAEVGTVSFTFVGALDGGGQRSISSDISLRNG